MTNELEIFAAVASTQTFIVLSAIFALSYTAWALWITGYASTSQVLPASLIRRAP
jgi:hypothetical protein